MMFVFASFIVFFLDGVQGQNLKCGSSKFTDPDMYRIIGGTSSRPGEWPWLVSLRFKNGNHKCGGSLINSQWILTAAHCVSFSNEALIPSNWLVISGDHHKVTLEGTEQFRDVTKVIRHERYNSKNYDNDIALMKLTKPVEFTDYIYPVCLVENTVETLEGKVCVAAGWGKLAEKGDRPDVVQQVSLPIINQRRCFLHYEGISRVTDGMICAGYETGGKATCQGDSGGPFVCSHPDGRWYLVGVTSWSVGCARPRSPAVFAKVSYFKDWINEKMKE